MAIFDHVTDATGNLERQASSLRSPHKGRFRSQLCDVELAGVI